MGQSSDSLSKEKVGLVRHPRLINMKQKKYPHIQNGVWFYEMPTALLRFVTYRGNLDFTNARTPNMAVWETPYNELPHLSQDSHS